MIKYSPILLALLLTFNDLLAQEQLPVGSHPPAVEFDHFPNRVYALVWRNWNLVEPARIAQTIGSTVNDVNQLAASMGLPPAEPISLDFKKQIYITIVRRNWHLLPYDQLLTLLDISSEELEFSLKEDDFLFHKLGNLKPKCSPLVYEQPDKKALARAREIKQLVQKHYKDALIQPGEPLFSFIQDLSSMDELPKQRSLQESDEEGLRFIYSYFGVFGDPLIDTEIDPYPEGLLARLAANGINGIWMHVVLNQLAPGGDSFPEFGKKHEERLANLRRIVERARKYGIKIYLYMNEPRAMPPSFFENRQEMAGSRGGDFIAMCTSNNKVLNWVSNSLTHVFQQVPDLGGVFTITASENFTHCASHGNQKDCPRCSKHDYADIIADVNKAITEGVHKGNPNAKVIVWDWGWYGHSYAPDIIAKLPKSVWLMSVSEWSKPIERGGVSSNVGEYSISAVGPGPRAERHWALAKAAGLKTVAKVQFNNTWELSAIPWLPTLDLVAQHASNLAGTDIDGVMLSWTLGGYPSPNLEIAHEFAQHPDAEPDAVLNALAIQRYGDEAAPYARKAWTAFSKAFQQFPYHIGVVYKGPQQYGPANLLYVNPTGYSSTMVGFPYDDMDGWRGPYPQEVFVSQFNKVAEGWNEGLDFFKEVIQLSDEKGTAQADWNVAKAAYLHFASVANQGRFIMARDTLLRNDLSDFNRRKYKKQINTILNYEITLAKELFQIAKNDSRIGYEATNQYYYIPQDLIEKVINCEYAREAFTTGNRDPNLNMPVK